MFRKYGKSIDMRMINRNLSRLKEMIAANKAFSSKLVLSDETLRKKCIVCGSEARELFLTVHDKYRYFECKDCGCLTLEKFPDVKSMYASEKTANGNIYIDKDTYKIRVEMIAKPKVDFVLENTKEPINSWLDIGCGGGGGLVLSLE